MKIKIIGITGGIASGKTTVVNEIRKNGYQVIDADQVVHDLQKKGGKLYRALLGCFGTEILANDGELNRPHLSKLIFSNPQNMTLSKSLQNSIIRQELLDRYTELSKTESVFFMDIPLLIEENYVDWFDDIWLLFVEEETQIERLMRRNNYSYEEAQKRISSQMPFKEKRKYANQIIDNNGTIEETLEQIRALLKKIV